MAKQLFANNATSMLSGILTQGGTALVCSNGEGNRFPSPAADEYFLLTIYTKDSYANEQKVEVVKVTSRTGDTLMIERDVELLTGQSGGYAYNGNTEQVYLELRWTAGGAGNVLQASDNLASLASALDARTNLGLGNVNNTADLDKPISNATQAALNGKADTGHTHVGFVSSTDPRLSDARPASDVSAWAKAATKPSYTKTDVGLGNVDNTSDANKPISTATQAALDLKENAANKGVANGYAGLDATGKVPAAQLPSYPVATASVAGTVKAGSGLVVAGDGTLSINALAVATQAEMEAGTESALRNMSPLLVKQAIVAQAVTPNGTQTLTNKTLTSPKLSGAPYTNGSARSNTVAVAALAIDCSLGNYFTKTINGASTFTFTNVPASGNAYAFTLELTHTSGTVTWPTSVKWPGDTAPTLTAAKTHLFTFVTDDGGTRWRGVANVNYTN